MARGGPRFREPTKRLIGRRERKTETTPAGEVRGDGLVVQRWRQMGASFIGSVWLGCSLAVRDYETPKVPGTLTIRLLKDSRPVKVTY